MINDDPLWYKDAIIYEMHVRAFHDSVGLGIGDFKGLMQKLDYLDDLGITAIWILPFYPSPLRDDGYDIADYTDIHADYGRIEDFKEFLDAAHHRGIRVITELVINHTSDKHYWFQRARHAPPGSTERNFYVWSDTPEKYKDARIIFKDFEPSNWSWDPVAKAYYWHRFYAHQPDLNYDNPAVWEAIFPVVDFWMGMGVDGMRLDAVPYLFEREGTNCENLPETHVFLQALRKHCDERWPNRMFIAEANQWPEDAIAYFGAGNECQMAFHFPLMPRLFMALHMEDRFPIVDILAQTPPIPDNCQWCLFLRNHDELTLEMVTDEERDYMYRAYASDPRARINWGIRRRLAPLLRNDRRRIELMKALLFSMPGTPVLYYGDEIGMGDNIYLGDRNGVRTPMQWSSDRNAGFSRANPQQLYLPIIIDPEYHYETVNVEAQQNNSSSLLWWLKRLIALRKQHKAFGRGTLQFLWPKNSKILAFIRSYGDEHILVVANLSRFVQHFELDLTAFSGHVPEELMGRSLFPAIGAAPYSLSIGPHGFYWFTLTRPVDKVLTRSSDNAPELPVLNVDGDWRSLFEPLERDRLIPSLIACLQRRWVLARGATIQSASIEDVLVFQLGAVDVRVPFVRVEFAGEFTPETTVLPITFVPADRFEHLIEPIRDAGIARLTGKQDGALCDALALPEYGLALLEAIAEGRSRSYPQGRFVAHPLPGLRELIELSPVTSAVRNSTARTNPSVVLGDRIILKAFRHVEAGVNPDQEMGAFLTARGFANIAQQVGYAEFRNRRGESSTLMVLNRFVPNQGDAWQLALDHLSGFFERVAALPRQRLEQLPPRVPVLAPLGTRNSEHLDELIGPFLQLVKKMGERSGEMHLALASEPTNPVFGPEPFGKLYQRSIYQSMRNLIGQVCDRLVRDMEELPANAQRLARVIADHRDDLIQRIQPIRSTPIDGKRIRCHGDYHLHHLLYTGNDFVVIDLEGDPTRTISERRIKRSPLRDVATFVRSFSTAGFSALYDIGTRGRVPGVVRQEDRGLLEAWVEAWHCRVAREFALAYEAKLEGSGLLPSSSEVRSSFLERLMLEDAFSEVVREWNAKSENVFLPLMGILWMME